MRKIYKQTLALLLVFVTLVGTLSGCTAGKPAETTAPVETEPAEEAKVLKVLTLGHSLGVNAGFMLNAVAAAEGYEHMVIGTLYYSGCPLYKHVEFLQNNSAEYVLYISSTETPNKSPEALENATMQMALQYDYWDVIVMMGSNKELAKESAYTGGGEAALSAATKRAQARGERAAREEDMDSEIDAPAQSDKQGKLYDVRRGPLPAVCARKLHEP